MFESRHQNQEYDDLVSLLRSSGVSRLDIAISTGIQDKELWPFYRSGLLRDALSEAKSLQHLGFRTDFIIPYSALEPDQYDSGGDKHFSQLTTLFFLAQWKKLRQFGLSGFIVKRHDLINFLCAMPASLRSVELSFPEFVETDLTHYREFVYDMREKINWRGPPTSGRPRITLYLESEPHCEEHCIDISREVEDFLYRDGENPFGEDNEDGFLGSRVYSSMGCGIERDMSNPLNGRPFVTSERLMEMGLREPPDFYLSGIRSRLKNRT